MKDARCQIVLDFMWLMWCLGAHLSWVWEMAALWMSRKWKRGKSQQISGMLLDHRTGSCMTACYKVRCITNYDKSHANVLLFVMQWTFATIFHKRWILFLLDPGKFNFTPRLYHLSAQSGTFIGVELISPSHMNGVITAMPFLQEKLYAVPHPGESEQVHILDTEAQVQIKSLKAMCLLLKEVERQNKS